MKTIFILFCVVFLGSCWAQETTYYLIGRPFTVEHNNAMHTVGKRWSIQFHYVSQQEMDERGWDELAHYTDSVFKKVANESSFGMDWYNEFVKQSLEIEHQQNAIRKKLLSLDEMKKTLENPTEYYLLFEEKKRFFKKGYSISFVVQRADKQGYETKQLYFYQTKKDKFKTLHVRNSCLPFELVQNGLIDPC